jgi:TolA-binding protein
MAFTSARINVRLFRYKVAAIIFNKGIQAFAKSIEVPDAMFHMAQCYLKGGDPKAAQKVCEACIEKYSKHRWRDTAKKRAEYIKANQ